MKLTWFGGTTIRIHIDDAILVMNPESVATEINATELVSGADRIIAAFGQDLPFVDAARWCPRRPQAAIERMNGMFQTDLYSIGSRTLLIDAWSERPLLLVAGDIPRLGRWAENATIVVFGEIDALFLCARKVLDARLPRLLVLAGPENALEQAIAFLRDKLDGTGLVALETRMPIEV